MDFAQHVMCILMSSKCNAGTMDNRKKRGRPAKKNGYNPADMDGVYYSGDTIAAFNLKSSDSNQYELLIRRDILDKYLQESNKMLFWTVVGEKQFFNSSYNQIWQRREGYYIYSDAKISGEIKIVKNR